jgi:hypothetical protein
VRRITAWIGGVAGGIAAYRLLRRRAQVAPEPTPTESDDRAEELRAKLAESKLAEPRAAEPVVEETPAEPVAGEEPERALEPESPEDRRRQVHEEGRAALDEMKSDGGG